MTTTRRRFLAQAAATGLAVSAIPSLSAFGRLQPAGGGGGKAAKSLKILILGGTGFIGPVLVEACKARGHQVTIFNRGRREKYYGAPEGVEKLVGNRDPKLHSREKVVDGKLVDDETSVSGLTQLEGRKWDAVFDDMAQAPRIVKASAELLAPNVGQYVYISSISAYKNNDKPNKDESDELATMADETVESMGPNFENYGPLKVLCEKAAEKAMPGRTTVIRPGYIVGPPDTSDRFTYWPVRVSKGGEVMVPGDPKDPVQFIDVRDLADFMIHCVETRTVGVFNATGPERVYTAGELMAACLSASKKTGGKSDAAFTYVPWSWFKDKEQQMGGGWPILIPPEGEYAGFHTRDVSKAVKAGLKFRTAEDTCVEILKWWPGVIPLRTKVIEELKEDAKTRGYKLPPLPDPTVMKAGVPAEKEAELLKLWDEEQKKK